MKRFISFFLCIILAFSLSGAALADEGRFDHFLSAKEWTDGVFTDVRSTDWFYDSVRSAYRMGLSAAHRRGFSVPTATCPSPKPLL